MPGHDMCGQVHCNTVLPAFICDGETLGDGEELPDIVIPTPQVTVSLDGMNLEYQYKIVMLWKSYVLKGRRSRNLP